MSIRNFYVDFDNGNNANTGTSALSPVRTWNAANIGGGTFQPGDTVWCRAGTTYDAAAGGRFQPAFTASPTAAAPFRVTTYGDPTRRFIIDGRGTRDIGFRGPPIDSANGSRFVTLENCEVKNVLSHGISIAEVLDTGVTEANNTVRNCYVHHTANNANPAIHIYGQNIRIERCLVEDVGGDGILARGRGYVGYNVVRRVGLAPGIDGDCIQFDGGFSGSVMERNICDLRIANKQPMLFVGSASHIRYNEIYGIGVGAGNLTVFQGQGNYVYGNLLVGRDGIYLLDATGPHTCSGNVVIGTDPNETEQNSTGIDCGATYVHAHVMVNNYVRNHARGMFGRNCVLRNNIVTACRTTGIDVSGGAGHVETNNYAWGNGTNFSTTPGPNSSTADMSQYVDGMGQLILPPGVTLATLAASNPLALGGFYVQSAKLMNGRLRPGFCPVGAYQAVLSRVTRTGI